jgi:multidrug efflux pump subunit AcrA (membrane-fusion protein)
MCLQGCKQPKAVPNTSGDKPGIIHAVGYLEPRGRLRRLAFQGSGVIQKIEYGIGDRVKAGEVVARLDDRIEVGQLATAEARLAVVEARRDLTNAGAHPDAVKAAEARHQAAEVEMAFRRSERTRLEGLRDRRSVSGVDMDTAVFADLTSTAFSDITGSELATLKNQVRAEDRTLLEAEATSSKAPLRGWIFKSWSFESRWKNLSLGRSGWKWMWRLQMGMLVENAREIAFNQKRLHQMFGDR